jgi:sorting nexin-1/2
MPSGRRRRLGRGLGFAERTAERMSGRRAACCGGSGDPGPALKRSSSSSSKAAEAGRSPEAAEGRKEPRKRSELSELLWRARSMAELSVVASAVGWGRRHVSCWCEAASRRRARR